MKAPHPSRLSAKLRVALFKLEHWRKLVAVPVCTALQICLSHRWNVTQESYIVWWAASHDFRNLNIDLFFLISILMRFTRNSIHSWHRNFLVIFVKSAEVIYNWLVLRFRVLVGQSASVTSVTCLHCPFHCSQKKRKSTVSKNFFLNKQVRDFCRNFDFIFVLIFDGSKSKNIWRTFAVDVCCIQRSEPVLCFAHQMALRVNFISRNSPRGQFALVSGCILSKKADFRQKSSW